jgi:hypothetical protein
MPLCGATTYEKMWEARSARRLFFGDKTFRVAAGTAPPTFIKLFSCEAMKNRVTPAWVSGTLESSELSHTLLES